jgi:hypothetical protein
MSKKFLAMMIALSTVSSLSAQAQDATSESKLKLEETKEKKNLAPGQDIDQEITNTRMRAEAGSKSRYSIASQIAYLGGSFEKPLNKERPNITNAAGRTDAALLGGQISGKYSFDQSRSLLIGAGVRWISPLQGAAMPESYHGSKVDADNPFAIYQILYKWSGIQSAFQLQPILITKSNLRKVGQVATLSLNQNNVYEVGQTGLSLGLYLQVDGSVYDKDDDKYHADQADYLVNFDPYLEYQITDKLNFRTVTNLWHYTHFRSLPAHTYQFDKVYQSVGLGYAMTRDVFFYPNVQFLPDEIRNDRTNIALNAFINLF